MNQENESTSTSATTVQKCQIVKGINQYKHRRCEGPATFKIAVENTIPLGAGGKRYHDEDVDNGMIFVCEPCSANAKFVKRGCEKISLLPEPNRNLLPPEPNRNLLPPEPNRNLLPPEPNRILLPPEPNRILLPPEPNRNLLPPEPNRNLLPPETRTLTMENLQEYLNSFKEKNVIKVATWNVGDREGHLMNEETASQSQPIISQLLKSLDILFLQELNAGSANFLKGLRTPDFFVLEKDGRAKNEMFLTFARTEFATSQDALDNNSFVVISFTKTELVNVHNEKPNSHKMNIWKEKLKEKMKILRDKDFIGGGDFNFDLSRVDYRSILTMYDVKCDNCPANTTEVNKYDFIFFSRHYEEESSQVFDVAQNPPFNMNHKLKVCVLKKVDSFECKLNDLQKKYDALVRIEQRRRRFVELVMKAKRIDIVDIVNADDEHLEQIERNLELKEEN